MALYALINNMKFNKLKSQAFFGDFVISILIFTVILIIYFTYTKNLSNEDTDLLDDLLTDAKTISLSFTSRGYPDNWQASDVVRIGFTDNSNRIDNEKFSEFVIINYNKSKKLLGTTYDYFLFFVNESGEIKNVEGFCGTGMGEVNITYDIAAAYYYQNREGEQIMKIFMDETFDATLYCDGGPKCDDLSFDNFISDINNYDFIIVEHPAWSTSKFDDFETAANPWLTAGGILFVGGEMMTPNQHDAFGVEFNKVSGEAPSDELATVVNEDEFIAFNLADNIIFRQAYWIDDFVSVSDFKDIARFNCTFSPRTCWTEFDDIEANGPVALARWPRGEGKILFFSDFDATYLAGNFQEILEGSAKKWANARCLPINISNIKRENLVKIDRLLIYNSDIVKMVFYLWQ